MSCSFLLGFILSELVCVWLQQHYIIGKTARNCTEPPAELSDTSRMWGPLSESLCNFAILCELSESLECDMKLSEKNMLSQELPEN